MLALDCYLLTFFMLKMSHTGSLPFSHSRYLPDASSSVKHFLFVADVKCVLYEIEKKQQNKCYTWNESSK